MIWPILAALIGLVFWAGAWYDAGRRRERELRLAAESRLADCATELYFQHVQVAQLQRFIDEQEPVEHAKARARFEAKRRKP